MADSDKLDWWWIVEVIVFEDSGDKDESERFEHYDIHV